jgi:hypothetical protein
LRASGGVGFFIYLVFSLVAVLLLFLAIFLDDAQLGLVVLGTLTVCAGLRWLLLRRHRSPTR